MNTRMALVIAIVCALGCTSCGRFENWSYDGSFHKLIAQADRVVVRDGGYDCCVPVDKQAICLSITNQEEIAELSQIIQFLTNQTREACLCCGYPGLDWYRGNKRLALTGVQHGVALRWRGFTGDARFTDESSGKLIDWFLKHGIKGRYDEFVKRSEEQSQSANRSVESTPTR